MEWKNDALGIYFAHMKNDQLGERPRDPRHVYSNPITPSVCPILSLGIYLLCFPEVLTQQSLYPGEKQYDRFRRLLSNVLQDREAKVELERRGLKSDDIGTHSIRKGSATKCSSGSTACPSTTAVHLRAGWALAGVQDTYMRYDTVGS